MALIIKDRNKKTFGCFRGSFNTSAASTSKLLNFANSALITNGVTIVSPSSVSVAETGLYNVSLTMGALMSASVVVTFNYGINGIYTVINSSVAATYAAGRFSLLIPLKENDQLSFMVSCLTASITSVQPAITNIVTANSPVCCMTIKKL